MSKNRSMAAKHALAKKYARIESTRNALNDCRKLNFREPVIIKQYDTISFALGYSARAKAARAKKLAQAQA